MSRKVFLSILGSSNYKTSTYIAVDTHFKSEPIRFVQEATIQYTGVNWSDDDRIFIFLTKGTRGSRLKNWNDNGHPNECDSCEGLKTRLTTIGLIDITSDVDIPDGSTSEEVWEVFNIIYGCIENGDEIYFDITHGFRFLPMLVLVLSNYTKFLKNTDMKQITYGNYESRNQTTNESPIINLTSLAELQDWTIGAQQFTTLGKTYGLSKLVSKLGNESEKSTACRYMEFANALKQLEGDFYTIRGKSLVSGEVVKKIRNSLKALKKTITGGPLDPIISEINKKIECFSPSDDLMNGFHAVEWCRKHKLIQQAYTLGQEIIISFICRYFGLNDNNRQDREYMGKILGIAKTPLASEKSKWAEVLNNKVEQSEELLGNSLVLEISKDYQNLSRFRNFINHGGFHGNVEWNQFERNFDKFYDRCLLILQRYGLDFLPISS